MVPGLNSEVPCGFPQSLQSGVGIVPGSKYDAYFQILSNSSVVLQSIRRCVKQLTTKEIAAESLFRLNSCLLYYSRYTKDVMEALYSRI
jgi:hypothetical protein